MYLLVKNKSFEINFEKFKLNSYKTVRFYKDLQT